MSERWAELFRQLPNFLGGHILLSLTALAVGLAVSVPLGIVVSRGRKRAELTLAVAGIVQTVPSLALLALMVLVLGMIGFEPAFVALTLYSILPILAGTITGLRGVDPTLTEAARGLGMNERQMLFGVQLPLAAPVIISGIRTATVMVVGTATLVSPVGGRSLGNYIFQGLESLNYESVAFGCILVAALAIVLDQLVHLFELASRRRSRRLAWLAGVGLLLVLATGVYPLFGRYLGSGARWAYIGSGSFTEQHILSEVIQQRLEPAGFRADKRLSMSEGIQFLALREGELDCMVNYTGNIWTLIMREKETKERAVVLAEVTRYLDREWGVACLPLGFDNSYAFAMRRDDAARRGIRSIDQLREQAPGLRLASDAQFLGRPEWSKVRDTYGLAFTDTRSMDQGLMYESLAAGEVDVITAYTCDGRIGAYDLVLLEDPERVFPPYDAVLLISPRAKERPGFLAALEPLRNAIGQEAMRHANHRVDVEKWTYPQAAAELLLQKRGARLLRSEAGGRPAGDG
jgi:osmoprotectant transport system permease protein